LYLSLQIDRHLAIGRLSVSISTSGGAVSSFGSFILSTIRKASAILSLEIPTVAMRARSAFLSFFALSLLPQEGHQNASR
jgi:hypothetical protein